VYGIANICGTVLQCNVLFILKLLHLYLTYSVLQHPGVHQAAAALGSGSRG
jgi:hypothetical protein